MTTPIKLLVDGTLQLESDVSENCPPVLDGLVAHYPFNSSKSPYVPTKDLVYWWTLNRHYADEFGRSHGEEFGTGNTFVSGFNQDYSVLFDGSSGAVKLDSHANFHEIGYVFFISVWFYSDSISGNTNARIFSRDLSDYGGIVLDQDSASGSQTLTMYNRNSANNASVANDLSTTISTGEWNHVVCGWDYANGKVVGYLNGVNIVDYTTNVLSTRTNYDSINSGSTRSPVLGCNSEGEDPSYTSAVFDGRISNVRIYKGRLPEAWEVRLLYCEQIPTLDDQSIVTSDGLSVDYANTNDEDAGHPYFPSASDGTTTGWYPTTDINRETVTCPELQDVIGLGSGEVTATKISRYAGWTDIAMQLRLDSATNGMRTSLADGEQITWSCYVYASFDDLIEVVINNTSMKITSYSEYYSNNPTNQRCQLSIPERQWVRVEFTIYNDSGSAQALTWCFFRCHASDVTTTISQHHYWLFAGQHIGVQTEFSPTYAGEDTTTTQADFFIDMYPILEFCDTAGTLVVEFENTHELANYVANPVITGNTWGTCGFFFALNRSNDYIYGYIPVSGTHQYFDWLQQAVSRGENCHIAVSWGNTNEVKTYFNGALSRSYTDITFDVSRANEISDNWGIGCRGVANAVNRPIGKIRSWTLYNRALSLGEIQALATQRKFK